MKEIFLRKEIHQFNSDALRHIFIDIVEQNEGAETLAIDFTAIEHVTGVFLGSLVFLLTKANEKGMAVQLVNVHPDIARIFRLTMLDKIFVVH